MDEKLKLLILAGVRPNFMKIAPLVREINNYNNGLKSGKTKNDYLLIQNGSADF